MYLEDSIQHVDPYWVDFNRKVVSFQEESSVSSNEDILETNGQDYATIIE
jgi:hypothetical protein